MDSTDIAIQIDWDQVAAGAASALGGSGAASPAHRGVSIRCPLESAANDEVLAQSARRLNALRDGGGCPVALEAMVAVPSAPQDRGRSAIHQAIHDVHGLVALADMAGIDLVIVHPFSRSSAARMARQCEESASHFLACLLAARLEAEAGSVRIAFDVIAADFLLAPTTARSFVDACNSCWVGAHLSVDAMTPERAQGDDCVSSIPACEWFEVLGRRVYSVSAWQSQMSPDIQARVPANAKLILVSRASP